MPPDEHAADPLDPTTVPAPAPAGEASAAAEEPFAGLSEGDLDATLAAAAPTPKTAAPAGTSPGADGPAPGLDDSAVLGSVPVAVSAADAVAFEAPGLEAAVAGTTATMEMLDDVMLDVRVELGRTNMIIEDVLKLGVGSVVSLDKLAGDPVDVFINERLIARGEVLVLNDNFCVRINAIQSPVPDEEPV